MTGTIINNMTVIDDADDETTWTGGTPGEVAGWLREGTFAVGELASAGDQEVYITQTARNMSNETIHGWMLLWGAPEARIDGGFGISVGDGTNEAKFFVGGSDLSGFHKNATGWQCFILSVPDRVTGIGNSTQLSGTEASIDDTNITELGYGFSVANKAVGANDNLFWDIMWTYDHTDYAAEITLGTSGSSATFGDLAIYDASTSADRALGILSEVATGVYELTAPLAIGEDGTAASYFSTTNEEVVFANVEYLNNHKLNLIANSTGQNEFFATGSTFRNVHAALPAIMDLSNTNFEYIQINGCNFLGYIDITLPPSSVNRFCNNSTFDGCGQIDPNTCEFENNTIRNTSDAATGALLLDASDTTNWGLLNFVSGGNEHGLYIPSGATGSYDLPAINTTGYAVSDGSGGNEFIYNNSGGAVTLNKAPGSSGNFSVMNGTSATTSVVDTVTLIITVSDSNGDAIVGARVFMQAASGGAAPYNDSVTITSTGTTATVAHTGHGMSDGEFVIIRGANEFEYNGWYAITNSTTNDYDYTMAGDPVDTATGTITATQGFMNEDTIAGGIASQSFAAGGTQPYEGRARESSGTPFYKLATFSGGDLSG